MLQYWFRNIQYWKKALLSHCWYGLYFWSSPVWINFPANNSTSVPSLSITCCIFPVWGRGFGTRCFLKIPYNPKQSMILRVMHTVFFLRFFPSQTRMFFLTSLHSGIYIATGHITCSSYLQSYFLPLLQMTKVFMFTNLAKETMSLSTSQACASLKSDTFSLNTGVFFFFCLMHSLSLCCSLL